MLEKGKKNNLGTNFCYPSYILFCGSCWGGHSLAILTEMITVNSLMYTRMITQHVSFCTRGLHYIIVMCKIEENQVE